MKTDCVLLLEKHLCKDILGGSPININRSLPVLLQSRKQFRSSSRYSDQELCYIIEQKPKETEFGKVTKYLSRRRERIPLLCATLRVKYPINQTAWWYNDYALQVITKEEIDYLKTLNVV